MYSSNGAYIFPFRALFRKKILILFNSAEAAIFLVRIQKPFLIKYLFLGMIARLVIDLFNVDF